MSNNWIQRGQRLDNIFELDPNEPNFTKFPQFGVINSISSNGNIVLTSAVSNDNLDGAGELFGDGAVYAFEFNDVSEKFQLKGSPFSPEPSSDTYQVRFGTSISLSSDGLTCAIGAPNYGQNDDGASFGFGAAYVYEFNDNLGDWQLKGPPFKGTVQFDSLGRTVCLSDDGLRVCIGSQRVDAGPRGRGQVYNFNDISQTWYQIGQTFSGSVSTEIGTGITISGDGSTISLNHLQNNEVGPVKCYYYNDIDDTWHQKGNTIETNSSYSDYDNKINPMSYDGNIILTNNDDSSLQIYYYNDIVDTWHQKGNTIFKPDVYPNFIMGFPTGAAMSRNGEYVVATASQTDNGTSGYAPSFVNVYKYDNLSDSWENYGSAITKIPDEVCDGIVLTQNDYVFDGIVDITDNGNSIIVGSRYWSATSQVPSVPVSNSVGYFGASWVLELTNSPIPCFTAGAIVQTDQGMIPIEDIKSNKHTIRKMKIINRSALTSQNADGSDYLVRFDKNALGEECPNKETVCSPLHMVFYEGKNIPAGKLCERDITGVSRQEYKGEKLYNIQLKEYSHMFVNGMRVETLHPRNIWAKKTVNK